MQWSGDFTLSFVSLAAFLWLAAGSEMSPKFPTLDSLLPSNRLDHLLTSDPGPIVSPGQYRSEGTRVHVDIFSDILKY